MSVAPKSTEILTNKSNHPPSSSIPTMKPSIRQGSAPPVAQSERSRSASSVKDLKRKNDTIITEAAAAKRSTGSVRTAAQTPAMKARPPSPAATARRPAPGTQNMALKPLDKTHMQGRATEIPRTIGARGAPPPSTILPSQYKTMYEGAQKQIIDLNLKCEKQAFELNLKYEELQSSLEAEQRKLERQRLRFEEEAEINEASLRKLQRKLEETQKALEDSEKLLEERTTSMTTKFEEEIQKRMKLEYDTRQLHNAIVDLKGQIRVAIKVRPHLPKELEEAAVPHLLYPSSSSIKLDMGKNVSSYDFNHVFPPTANQGRVFTEVSELIQSCLHGYNVSIIAFGQTGSGKTYTMMGGDEPEEIGIIPRAVHMLFNTQNELKDLAWEFEFSASFLEVYNDEIYDLLNNRKKLNVRMAGDAVVVEGIEYKTIDSPEKIHSILQIADRCRSTAATDCNEKSSRSHAVFELRVKGSNAKLNSSFSSCLHLVDLAGSERVKESGVQGERFKEATHINTALSNLQNCIRCLLGKKQHVPYRNSKLTMLLRDSLGSGQSKTMVIVSLNPCISQTAETKRSLEFAHQMSITHIGAAKKQLQ